MKFQETALFRNAFCAKRTDSSAEEQAFFRAGLEAMRERVAPIVARVTRDMPNYTVHDITHLDALWETASLIADGATMLNPPEAFVFGGAVLLHDASMSLAAYPNGVDDLRNSTEWNDAAAIFLSKNGVEPKNKDLVIDVLRLLHAKNAEKLATQGWPLQSTSYYLIDDPEVRQFYGPTIGLLAHSHWWSISKVARTLDKYLGAMPPRTANAVDLLKISGLLRVADATHLDRRRAPPFVRALDRPQGISDLHWQFQGRLSFPRIDGDALQFTAGEPCPISDADSWWLGYDALALADRELRETDLLLRDSGRNGLRARRVKDVENPSALAADIPVSGWKPINTQLHVSDVPRIVAMLGGSKLYGNDTFAPLRELLQNASDAIQARRRLYELPAWGQIKVTIEERELSWWLVVEDDGIGMSERVLTTNLIDFGSSLWRSSSVTEEFPGLASKGMDAVGQFGIGFFSVFMIGQEVHVTTRRCDRSVDEGLRLSFSHGLTSRPILSNNLDAPTNGGTRVEIKLFESPYRKNDIFYFYAEGGKKNSEENFNLFKLNDGHIQVKSLKSLVARIAPCSDVNIDVSETGNLGRVVSSEDWLNCRPEILFWRATGIYDSRLNSDLKRSVKIIHDDKGRILGRGTVWPKSYSGPSGALTQGGFRIQPFANIVGVVLGAVDTAARNIGRFEAPAHELSGWATEQAKALSRISISEERKALSAEIVLELGGSIGKLPIVQRNRKWISVNELKTILNDLTEVSLHFGDIDYEEDDDEVTKNAFENDFIVDKDIFIIPRLDTLTGSEGYRFRQRKESMILNLFEKTLKSKWKKYNIAEEQVTVGEVEYVDIVRGAYVYRRWPSTSSTRPPSSPPPPR